MKVSVNKFVGKDSLTFEVEGSDLKDALEKASFYTDSRKKGGFPNECGICHDADLSLISYRTREKNFLYVKIRCNKAECGGFSELGLNTKTNQYYWKPFEQFIPNQPTSGVGKTEDNGEVGPEDIPF